MKKVKKIKTKKVLGGIIFYGDDKPNPNDLVINIEVIEIKNENFKDNTNADIENSPQTNASENKTDSGQENKIENQKSKEGGLRNLIYDTLYNVIFYNWIFYRAF